MRRLLTIAVDFDGTLVENRYPEIGKPILFAFETIKKLQQEGHQIILWTYRCGKPLEDAVAFCKKKGVEFYAINKSYPEEEYDPRQSRKNLADIFIDDRNLNGLIPWGEVYHKLTGIAESEVKEKPGKSLLNLFKR